MFFAHVYLTTINFKSNAPVGTTLDDISLMEKEGNAFLSWQENKKKIIYFK